MFLRKSLNNHCLLKALVSLLLPLFLLSNCSKPEDISITRHIPPHTTHPKVIHDVKAAALPYDELHFYWDKFELDEKAAVPGNTADLKTDTLVCHTPTEVSEHVAWVKRAISPLLHEVMNLAQIDEEKQAVVVTTVNSLISIFHDNFERTLNKWVASR